MIGVFGGTFDPIHFGHLRPALDILQDLSLQEIRFVPLRVAVHRTQPEATAAQRLAMLRRAVAGQPGFVVDERELARGGGSYSYDTLASLRDELGPGLPICLLTGLDAFRDFLSWYRPEGILELAHLVVMRRPGVAAPLDGPLMRWLEPRLAAGREDLARVPSGRVLLREVTQLDISASAVRALIARGHSPRYLLPDQVLALIERQGLYRQEPREEDAMNPFVPPTPAKSPDTRT